MRTRTAAVGVDALVRRVEECDERRGQQAAHVVLHVRSAHRAPGELQQRWRLEHAALARELHHQRTARSVRWYTYCSLRAGTVRVRY